MKIPFLCPNCVNLESSKLMPNDFAMIDIRDDGLYEFTCSNGHKVITILQEQPFEMQFELGVSAIIDGYYREAVSSFTSSLERFYEFFINLICLSRDLDKELIIKTFKLVANNSERELGAFPFNITCLLYKPLYSYN
jgi:hypothetical protein